MLTRSGYASRAGQDDTSPSRHGFVPVTWEDFDIVLSGKALPAAESLIAALRDPDVQSSICALGGYDVSRACTIELLV